jgi:hypothetical protein
MTESTGFDLILRWNDSFDQLTATQRNGVVHALASAIHEGWEPNSDDLQNLVDYARGAVTEAEYVRCANVSPESQ